MIRLRYKTFLYTRFIVIKFIKLYVKILKEASLIEWSLASFKINNDTTHTSYASHLISYHAVLTILFLTFLMIGQGSAVQILFVTIFILGRILFIFSIIMFLEKINDINMMYIEWKSVIYYPKSMVIKEKKLRESQLIFIR